MRTRTDLTSEQIAALGALVSGRISTNDSVLDLHGRDESAFPPVKPSAVITVHSTEEVSAVLKYCNTHDIPVVAFGAGTSLEGHVLPLFGGISLDLSAMDKILEISPDDLTVRVQAGVKRMALNKKIASDGLFFSVDPGADATIGGMTSTGAAGTTTVRYGSMRENVLKLTAVLADGTIIHAGRETRKLSAGYDLTRLIVGSEGTLAIVTEITLRVFGIPEKMAAAVSRFPTLADGVQAAIAIVRSGVSIARCEFLDAQCIKNVNAHDALDLEEAPTLLFEFHGSPRSVEEDAQVVQEIAAEFGGTNFEWTSEEGARRKLWQARHNAYWAGISAHPGKRAISTDAAVPLSKLADAVALTEKILSESPFPFSILGHVADGNFHAFIITDPNKPEELPAVRELTHHMTDAIIDMGGTCTGEHGIGAGKISSLEKEAGPGSMAVMASIKNALDPKGILNPGKIFH
ncbi:GlcD FAD/FMN-containing dehydrogenases [Candidatus Nanopelagicaceae bacterium]